MLKKKGFVAAVLVITVALIGGLVAGCAPAAPSPKTPTPPAKVKFLKIGTGPVGGWWFPCGSVLATIISEEVEGVDASPTLGGGVSNCRDVNKGAKDIGFTFSGTALDAWNGNTPFKEKQTNIRFLANMYISPFHIIALKKFGIKTVEDLKGQPFSPGKKGYTGKLIFDRLLKEYDMTYDDLGELTLTGYSDGALLLKDEHIHFYALITVPPSASFLDVATVKPVSLVEIDPKVLDTMAKKYGMAKLTIPAGTYPGQDKDVPSVGYGNCFIIRKGVPKDVVYEITKALWKNYKDFHEVQPKLKNMTLPKNALKGATIPLHPGAYKYYKEQGFKIPQSAMPVK